MKTSTPLKQPTIAEVAERIFASRRITRLDQYLLMNLTFIGHEESSLINQVYEGLHRGTLRVVD